MGRHGPAVLADEPAFAAAVAELEPVFVEQVGFSLQQVLDSGEPVVGIDRIQPVLVGMQLALTELWRSYGVDTRCGDRAFDGGGDRGGGGRGAEPGRRAEGDRHPVAADVAAFRTGRDGAVGNGCGRRREFDRRLCRPHGGGVAAPNLTTIAGPPEQVDDDRGGRRSGPAGAPRRGRRGVHIIRPSDRSCPNCALRSSIWRR